VTLAITLSDDDLTTAIAPPSPPAMLRSNVVDINVDVGDPCRKKMAPPLPSPPSLATLEMKLDLATTSVAPSATNTAPPPRSDEDETLCDWPCVTDRLSSVIPTTRNNRRLPVTTDVPPPTSDN